MSTPQGEQRQAALELADLFKDCVECFGLIHRGRDSRSHRLLLTQLGIEQAKLLAWGLNLGIAELSFRDSRLDEEGMRTSIRAALLTVIDKPLSVDRVTQFETFGLKPFKLFLPTREPAVDYARLEAFRSRYALLGVRRARSLTINHWMIEDTEKFAVFVLQIRESIKTLIDLMGNQEHVDRAVKSDIRALGWHPIFDRGKMAADTTRLRLIQDACSSDYPDYATAAGSSLLNLDREWKEGLTDANQPSEIEYAAAGVAAAKPKDTKDEKSRRRSLFTFLRSSSWRKSKTEDPRRTGSSGNIKPPQLEPVAHEQQGTAQDEDLDRIRSKSFDDHLHAPSDSKPLSEAAIMRIDTASSTLGTHLDQSASLISRHDRAI